jgi:hypothetical protein
MLVSHSMETCNNFEKGEKSKGKIQIIPLTNISVTSCQLEIV